MRPQPAIDGIDLRAAEQLALLESMAVHWSPFLDNQDSVKLYRPAQVFPLIDAVIYASFLQLHRPARIIEIGSGYSSALALDVCRTDSLDTHLTFIEPFPDERLTGLLANARTDRHEVIAEPVQDTPLDLFDSLESGDLLFVDGSHIVKAGSDTAWTIFNILPRLAEGVIVQIHDMFWPFEYPSTWLRDGRSFNELYFVRSFLQFNSAYQIELFSNWAWQEHPAHFDFIRARVGTAWPTSLYIRRLKPR